MKREERGAALLVVVVALAALMPLALLLSDFALARQRQLNRHQQGVGSQAAVRGALDVALTRLQSRQIALDPAQSARFELELPPRTVRVIVTRERDAILGLDGRVIDPEDAADLEVDLDRVGIDPLRGAVREFRKIEVYRVEAECPARYPFAAVRLLAVVGRLEEGLLTLGVRYDRGYFP